jgi:hypothetical protein
LAAKYTVIQFPFIWESWDSKPSSFIAPAEKREKLRGVKGTKALGKGMSEVTRRGTQGFVGHASLVRAASMQDILKSRAWAQALPRGETVGQGHSVCFLWFAFHSGKQDG